MVKSMLVVKISIECIMLNIECAMILFIDLKELDVNTNYLFHIDDMSCCIFPMGRSLGDLEHVYFDQNALT